MQPLCTPVRVVRVKVCILKGFSRLVVGFDVHKNHTECPRRSVLTFFQTEMTQLLGKIPLKTRKVTNCAG